MSTALIEAGINVSFPIVVRSLAGMPSIVQAAGRCNRSMEYGSGAVYVWEFAEEKLRRLPDIQNGGNITRAIAAHGGSDFGSLSVLDTYFKREEDYMRPYIKKLGFPKQIVGEYGRITEIIRENGWLTGELLGTGYLHAFYTYEMPDQANRKGE